MKIFPALNSVSLSDVYHTLSKYPKSRMNVASNAVERARDDDLGVFIADWFAVKSHLDELVRRGHAEIVEIPNPHMFSASSGYVLTFNGINAVSKYN